MDLPNNRERVKERHNCPRTGDRLPDAKGQPRIGRRGRRHPSDALRGAHRVQAVAVRPESTPLAPWSRASGLIVIDRVEASRGRAIQSPQARRHRPAMRGPARLDSDQRPTVRLRLGGRRAYAARYTI